MTEPIKFQFTRHALSCNNVELGSNLAGKDFEPSITDHALLQLSNNSNGNYLRHENSDVISNDDNNKLDEFNFDRFKQNTVDNHLYILVSPLIRTWETAVVLYGIGNPKWETMNLYIGPHLKEFTKYGNQLLSGNFYESPETIIPKFKNFLQILLDKPHESMNGFEENNKKIILHWPKFKGFNMKNPNFVTFTFTMENGSLNVTSSCENNNLGITLGTIGNYYVGNNNLISDNKGYFRLDGNLQKFMELFKDETNYDGYPKKIIIETNNEKKVHVVTHSNVMQDYIKNIYGFDMKNDIPDELPDSDIEMKKLFLIKNSNNWTFTESYREENQIIEKDNLRSHLKMQLGVPNEAIKTGNKILNKKEQYVDEKIKDFVKKNYKDNRKLCGIVEKIDKKMTCKGEENKMTTNLKNIIQRKNISKIAPEPLTNDAPSGGKRKSRKLKKSKKRRKNSKTRRRNKK